MNTKKAMTSIIRVLKIILYLVLAFLVIKSFIEYADLGLIVTGLLFAAMCWILISLLKVVKEIIEERK